MLVGGSTLLIVRWWSARHVTFLSRQSWDVRMQETGHASERQTPPLRPMGAGHALMAQLRQLSGEMERRNVGLVRLMQHGRAHRMFAPQQHLHTHASSMHSQLPRLQGKDCFVKLRELHACRSFWTAWPCLRASSTVRTRWRRGRSCSQSRRAFSSRPRSASAYPWWWSIRSQVAGRARAPPARSAPRSAWCGRTR